MAILIVTKLFEDRSATGNLTGGNKYVDYYHVLTSGRTVGASVVMVAIDPGGTAPAFAHTLGTRIPRVGEAHPDDRFATVRHVTPKQTKKSDVLWKVRVEYSAAAQAADEHPIADPLMRPRKVAFGSRTTSEEMAWDESIPPQRVVDTAGSPFDPGVFRDVTRPVMIVQYNSVRFYLDQVVAYYDAVNSDRFWVDGQHVHPGEAKIISWTASFPTVEGGIAYYANTVQLGFKRPHADGTSGWQAPVECRGFLELVPDPIVLPQLNLTPILLKKRKRDETGAWVEFGDPIQSQDPVALNELGQAIPGGDPFVKTFRRAPEKEFGPLPWTG